MKVKPKAKQTDRNPWPASEVVMRPVADLVPYARNARTHSAGQVDKIAASMREWGWTNPILVDEGGGVIAGHGRLMAAQKLGYEDAPCVVARGWSEAQKRAYVIADNRLALDAGWDDEMLGLELAELDALDFNLDLTGFNESELEGLLSGDDELEDPPVPEPPDKATTWPGDLWVLGRHRLLCGDSANWEDVERLLGGTSIHLVNTDPPYNVKVEPRSNNAIAAGLSSFTPTRQTHRNQSLDLARHPEKAKPTGKMRPKDRPLQNDFMSDEEFARLLRAWFGNAARALLPGRAFYVWGGYANLANYPPALAESGLYYSQGIVWNKLHPVLTRKDFMGAFELAFYGWKEGAAHVWCGPTNATDMWEIKKLNHTAMVHLTEKPVELAGRAMRYSSRRGENVLDLFGGSGSTMAAAEQLDRCAFSMEIDPLYCDVIVMRWQNASGHDAALDGDGRTFAEVAEDRKKENGRCKSRKRARVEASSASSSARIRGPRTASRSTSAERT